MGAAGDDLLADVLGNPVVIPAAGDNDVDVVTEVFKLLSY